MSSTDSRTPQKKALKSLVTMDSYAMESFEDISNEWGADNAPQTAETKLEQLQPFMAELQDFFRMEAQDICREEDFNIVRRRSDVLLDSLDIAQKRIEESSLQMQHLRRDMGLATDFALVLRAETEVLSKQELALAAEAHLRNCLCTDEGGKSWSVWSTAAEDFKAYGTGIRLHFKFLYVLACAFVFAGLLGTPVVLLSSYGDGLVDMNIRNSTLGSLAKISLGNLNSDGTVYLGSSKLIADDVTFFCAVLDAIAVVVILMVTLWLEKYGIYAAVKEERTKAITPATFTIYVNNLPHHLEGDVHENYDSLLAEHFNFLLSARVTPDSVYKGMKVIAAKDRFNFDSSLAPKRCSCSRKNYDSKGRLVGKVLEVLPDRKSCMVEWPFLIEPVVERITTGSKDEGLLDAVMLHHLEFAGCQPLQGERPDIVHSVALVRDFGGHVKTLREQVQTAEKVVHKATEMKKNNQCKVNLSCIQELQLKSLPVLGAFVTLRLADRRDFVIYEYRFSRSRMGRLCQAYRHRFQGHKITVSDAPIPSNVFWDNLDVPTGKRIRRSTFVFFAFLAVLIFMIGALSVAKFIRATAQSQTEESGSDILSSCKRESPPIETTCYNVTYFDENGTMVSSYRTCTLPNATNLTGSTSRRLLGKDDSFPIPGTWREPRRTSNLTTLVVAGFEGRRCEDYSVAEIVSDSPPGLHKECGASVDKQIASSAISVGASLSVIFINFAISRVILLLADIALPETLTSHSLSSLQMTFVLKTLTLGIVSLLVNANFDFEPKLLGIRGILCIIGAGEYKDFSDNNRRWFGVVGSEIMFIFLGSALNPLLALPDVLLFRFRTWWARGRKANWQKLRDLHTPKQFQLSIQQAELLSAVVATLIFSSLLPVLPALLAVRIILQYWSDKYTFLRGCHTPPRYAHNLAESLSGWIRFAVFMHGLVAVWVYGNEALFPSNVHQLVDIGDVSTGEVFSYIGKWCRRATKKAAIPGFMIVCLVLLAWLLDAFHWFFGRNIFQAAFSSCFGAPTQVSRRNSLIRKSLNSGPLQEMRRQKISCSYQIWDVPGYEFLAPPVGKATKRKSLNALTTEARVNAMRQKATDLLAASSHEKQHLEKAKEQRLQLRNKFVDLMKTEYSLKKKVMGLKSGNSSTSVESRIHPAQSAPKLSTVCDDDREDEENEETVKFLHTPPASDDTPPPSQGLMSGAFEAPMESAKSVRRTEESEKLLTIPRDSGGRGMSSVKSTKSSHGFAAATNHEAPHTSIEVLPTSTLGRAQWNPALETE